MKYLNLFLVLLAILGFATQSQGQSPQLDQYISMGLENNHSLKRHQLSYKKSQEALREAKGLYMPALSFNASYSLAGGGRKLEFPIGDLLNPVYSTLNQLTESQNFPTDLANVSEQFAPNNFQETKLRLIQPVYNPALGINRKLKEVEIEMNGHEKEAYKQSLIRDIRLAYFAYLQSEEALNIYAETETLIHEIIRVNKSLVKNDKATPVVISRSEFELSKIQKDKSMAEAQTQTARAYFNFLVNRPLETPIEIDENLKTDWFTLSLEQLGEQALNNRWELAQLKSAKVAQAQAVKLNKTASIPRLNFIADGGFQGFGYDFGNQGYWLALVSLQWDIFSGFQRKSRLEQSRIDQRSLILQQDQLGSQIQLQVRKNWYELEAVRIRIQSDRKGLKAARDTYRLTEKLYKESKSSLLELLDARTQLTQARLTLSIDAYSFLSKKAELQWASGEIR